VLGVGLTVLSLALLEVGLFMRSGDLGSYWQGIPLWSAFATLCALLGLLAFAAFFPAGNRMRSGPAWRVAAAGLVGLAIFWLLVVLPVADTDRGFVLTAALGALGGALWIGPRRKD
jgi:phosphoglycerol transferase MdoB-like AlkP superfamily enzyme